MESFAGVIGIDLGTTFSCVAVLMHDTVHVIPNDQGNRTTPSRVGFVNGATLVGDAAANGSVGHPKQVIYDAKRMIGRKWSDPEIQRDKAIWPFTIAEASEGVEIVVDPNNETAPRDDAADESLQRFPVKRLAPEQVSAILLRYLKACAERHLGKTVTRAVITVPAYFNDAQRERTRAAGKIAGLEVLRIVNEPTAAALAYGLDKSHDGSEEPRNILVFDFGGGTFDVSVITVDCGAFMVVSTAGHTHLGGQDIDAALTKFFINEISRRHKVDVSDRPKSLARLRLQAERAKKALSHSHEYHIEIDGVLPDGAEFTMNLSRAKLEELCAPLFKLCIDTVQKALSDAKMTKQQIHDVVMVGGSSRIPKVRALVSEFFGNKELNCTMNPDEAIAVGAAIQAAILSNDGGQQSERLRDVVLMDVTPLSLGVDVDDGKFDVLIPRNHTIPHKVMKEFSTYEKNQTDVTVSVYEGERPLVKHNRLLGEFELSGITKAAKGVPSIFVTFDVDANGLLTVTAEEKMPAKKGCAPPKKSLVVKSGEKLSTEDIMRMIEEAETMRAEDDEARRHRDELTRYDATLEYALQGLAKVKLFKVFIRKRGLKLVAQIDNALTWLRHTAPQMPAKDAQPKFEKLERLASKAERLFRKCEANPEEIVAKKKKKASDGDGDDSGDASGDEGEGNASSGAESHSDESDMETLKPKKHRPEN